MAIVAVSSSHTTCESCTAGKFSHPQSSTFYIEKFLERENQFLHRLLRQSTLCRLLSIFWFFRNRTMNQRALPPWFALHRRQVGDYLLGSLFITTTTVEVEKCWQLQLNGESGPVSPKASINIENTLSRYLINALPSYIFNARPWLFAGEKSIKMPAEEHPHPLAANVGACLIKRGADVMLDTYLRSERTPPPTHAPIFSSPQ